MIPKVIHYIWLGGNPLPKVAEKCLKSWQKFCPDYEIKRWDETNLDLNKYQFVKDAIQAKKYAFASDVLRTEILYNEGGIYLDVDVELLKPIDELLKNESFYGYETQEQLAPGLIMGAKKGDVHLKNILEIYQNTKFEAGKTKEFTVCIIYTNYFKKLGLKQNNTIENLGGVVFYPKEYFCPIDVNTGKKTITKNTHSIHWYISSWYTPKQKCLKGIKKFLNIITFGLAGKIYNRIKNR